LDGSRHIITYDRYCCLTRRPSTTVPDVSRRTGHLSPGPSHASQSGKHDFLRGDLGRL